VKPTMLSIIKGGVSYCIANDARLLPGSQGTMAAKTKSRASWQTAKRQPFANRIPSRDIGTTFGPSRSIWPTMRFTAGEPDG